MCCSECDIGLTKIHNTTVGFTFVLLSTTLSRETQSALSAQPMAVAPVRLSFHSLDIHTLVDVLEQTRSHLQKSFHKEPRDAPRTPRVEMENICHSFVHFSCEEMGCDTEFNFSLSPKIKKEYSPTKLVTCVLSCHCERLHTHTTTFPPVGLVLSRDQKFVHNF